jgi:hypothetical protein
MALKSTISNMAKEYASTVVENGAFQGSVDAYLANNMTNTGTLIHWSAMLSSGFLNSLASSVVKLDQVSTEVAQYMNKVFTALKDPNIEGIPIKSAKVTVHREVEVSDYGVVTGKGYYHKNIADNAVPKPRTWTVTGFITSVWDVDTGFILKPSLLLQAKLLDAFAQSRRPLWFKTDENEFVKVQITDIQIERVPEYLNGESVVIQLKEFVPLEIMTNVTGVYKAALQVQQVIMH